MKRMKFSVAIARSVAPLLLSCALLSPALAQTPILAAGLKKVVSTYTGPAMRLQRLSDNAQVDINFTASGNVDTTGMLSFLGSNTALGYIVTLYDQSGNGNDLTQTVVANAPSVSLSAPTTITSAGITYTTARSVIGASAYETALDGPGYWNIPSTLSTNLISTTVIEALRPDFSGGEGFEAYNLGNSSSTAFDLVGQFGGDYGLLQSNGAWLTYGSGFYWRSQPTVVALASVPGSAPQLYFDGVANAGISGLTSATLTGGTLLGGILNNYTSFANFLAFEVFSSSLTQTQIQTISSALLPRTTPAVNIVADGDSITEGHCAVYGQNALHYAEPNLSVPVDITNIATGGAQTSNPINNSSSPTVAASHYARLYQPTYGANILYLAIGTNDIHVYGATGAATWANVQTILTNAKSIGYKTAVASVMHEANESSTAATQVTAFNSLLYAAQGGSLVDTVIDYASAAVTFCDGVHPTDAGYAVMGGLAATALNGLIPATTTPVATPVASTTTISGSVSLSGVVIY